MPFFQLFVLGNIGYENVLRNILKRKDDFLSYKNKKFKKSKNWHFFKGVNPWFWSKKGHFSNFFFRQYGQRKFLLRYCTTKITAFLGYKSKKLKKSKIDIFPKRLTHGFGPRMASFLTFFLGNIGKQNVFYDILQQKNFFLGYKNKKFKK